MFLYGSLIITHPNTVGFPIMVSIIQLYLVNTDHFNTTDDTVTMAHIIIVVIVVIVVIAIIDVVVVKLGYSSVEVISIRNFPIIADLSLNTVLIITDAMLANCSDSTRRSNLLHYCGCLPEYV